MFSSPLNDNIPLDSRHSTQKVTQLKKTSTNLRTDSDHHQMNEIAIMKRDINEKNNQISHLNKNIEQFQQLTDNIFDIILELEGTTSLSFLSPEQKFPGAHPQAFELIGILKQALKELVSISTSMPQRYEIDFTKKATELANEINETSDKIHDINIRKAQIIEETQKLERLAHIQEQELSSLAQIDTNLQNQKLQIDNQRSTQQASLHEQVQTYRTNAKELKKISRLKEEKNQKTAKLAYKPLAKKTLDFIKEDVEIQEEIDQLHRRLDRELQEHQMTRDELEMTNIDIERAKGVIEKFKQSLTKEQKENADRINDNLKHMIEQQREDFKRAMRNQRKANSELDKQKADLIEEEKMLRSYLQTLEKQLQMQMNRLPSLSILPSRYEPETQQRRGALTKSKQRAPDDAEMRLIKKAILRMQNRRNVSRSVLVGKTYK